MPKTLGMVTSWDWNFFKANEVGYPNLPNSYMTHAHDNENSITSTLIAQWAAMIKQMRSFDNFTTIDPERPTEIYFNLVPYFKQKNINWIRTGEKPPV
jgi:hypothetical protein